MYRGIWITLCHLVIKLTRFSSMNTDCSFLLVFIRPFSEIVDTVQTVRRPTISFSASSVSTSPILAAAHASGGVRASRMAASSCRHNQATVSSSMLTHTAGLKGKTCSVAETEQCGKAFGFSFFGRGAHLFAADAERFGDDLDEAAVAQTQLGARKVAAHLASQVLSHQLDNTQTHKISLFFLYKSCKFCGKIRATAPQTFFLVARSKSFLART